MLDEEKKAVETLKDLASTIYYGDMNFIESDDLKIILNLIEKQQKEIEKLLKDYKQDKKIIQEMVNYIKNEWGFANNDEVIDYFRKRCKQ